MTIKGMVSSKQGYSLSKFMSLKAGYSQMWGSSSLEAVRGGDADRTQNWAWFMVNFNPKILTFIKDN